MLHAHALPSPDEMKAALGVEDLRVEEVPDVAAERLRELARPEPVDGRLLVRADWMAPLPGVEEVVLADTAAFGTGAHPTTRDCLSMLLSLEPGGAFADLGCGAGVLAIAAARLGWAPVHARDVVPRAVRATEANARANGVELDVAEADLLAVPPPAAGTVAANVPVDVHRAIAAAWTAPPERLILSGVHASERDAVLAAYTGFTVAEERAAEPWLTLLLHRGDASPRPAPAPATAPAAVAPPPAPEGERLVELGARAALFDLPGNLRFDVWALDDSLRWALRGPPGTEMEVEEESRLPIDDDGPDRPPSTVRLRLLVSAPGLRQRVTLHVTVSGGEPGLVKVAGSAVSEVA